MKVMYNLQSNTVNALHDQYFVEIIMFLLSVRYICALFQLLFNESLSITCVIMMAFSVCMNDS